MFRWNARFVLPLAAGLALASCARNDDLRDACALAPGDLVITEIMADPPGTDTGKEWFEVYNPGDSSVDVTNLVLVVSKADGSAEGEHVVVEGSVPAKGYFTFGDFREGKKPTWLNYTYADQLKALGNSTGGRVAVRCGDTIIDEAVYSKAPANASLTLSGKLTPSPEGNDDAANWCAATSVYVEGAKGTPGAKNDVCGGPVNPGGCTDEAGASRMPVTPQPGDLILSEVLADPKVTADDDGEWIELFVTSAVDLNGVEIANGTSQTTLSSASCIHVEPGEFVLLGRKSDPLVNGGQTMIGTFSFALANSGGTLTLKAGDIVIDTASYGPATPGVSTQLDVELLDAEFNDEPSFWCESNIPMDNGDYGTPGYANDFCDAGPTPTDQCADPDTGAMRDIESPLPGDLIVTEFMANPKAADDTKGEWVEVYVRTAVDLNGIALVNEGKGKTVLAAGDDCARVEAGTYLLFARSIDPELNGGLPSPDGVFGFTLANSGDRSIALKLGDAEIDRITYTSTGDGVATQLDKSSFDAELNDSGIYWCAAPTKRANGDTGTPGTPNVSCP